MKKILLILILFLLTGCSSNTYIEAKDNYITPLNEINYYDNLSDAVKSSISNVISKSKESEVIENTYFDMLGEKLTELSVKDYDDESINFSDFKDSKLVVEIVQAGCEHCLAQTKLTEDILKHVNDVTVIQYFAYGTKDEIDEFYSRAEVRIPSKLIVIPQNKELSNYFFDIGVRDTPTFIFFDNGILKLARIGLLSYAQYENAYELAYNSDYSKDILVNNDGESVFSLYRGYNDLLDDLSVDSKDKMALVDNAEDLTVNVMGKEVLFNTLYEKEDGTLFNLTSYQKFINKPLVLFYIADVNNNLEADVNLINEFVSKHKKLNAITILVDNKDINTSKKYVELDLKLKSKVLSKTGYMPQTFNDISVNEYPSVLFIQDNIFTGGIRCYKDLDNIEKGLNLFIGDESIALKAINEEK